MNREYRTLAVIRQSSWEQLGLSRPELTMEEKSEITGLSVDELNKFSSAAKKFLNESDKTLSAHHLFAKDKDLP